MLKDIVGTFAVVLIFVGYFPYIRDIYLWKTKPHMYTWFIWALLTGIIFLFQYWNGGGLWSFVTLGAALICFYIFVLSFKYWTRDVTISDKIFLYISLFIGIVWFFTSDPLITVILLCCADVFGFVPTIRKSWSDPYGETLSSYSINTIRFVFAIYALSEYNLITLSYPVVWMLANGLFALFLVWRRQVVVNKNLKS